MRSPAERGPRVSSAVREGLLPRLLGICLVPPLRQHGSEVRGEALGPRREPVVLGSTQQAHRDPP